MRPGLSVIGGFFLRAILALVPSLALWFWARDWVVKPVAWLAERVLMFFFPTWIYGSELEGTTQALLTTIRVPQRSGAIAELVPEVNVLLYCYGLPMLVALLVASLSRGWWWKIPLGAIILWPVQAWGVVFDFLIQVGAHHGQLSAPVTGFSLMQVNGFGIAYQLGYLVLPTLIPILLWLKFERRFLGMVMFDAALSGATRWRR